MVSVPKAAYVFVGHGRVIASSDSPDDLFARFEERALGGAAVKPWRVHIWGAEDGDISGVLNCVSCKEARLSDGRNASDPCPFPERNDPSIKVFKQESSLLAGV